MQKLSPKYPLKYAYNNFLMLNKSNDVVLSNIMALLDIIGGEQFVFGEVLWDSRIGTVVDIFRHENLSSLEQDEIQFFLQKAINLVFEEVNIYEFEIEKDLSNKTLNIKMTIEITEKDKTIKKGLNYEWSY